LAYGRSGALHLGAGVNMLAPVQMLSWDPW
jgi:hypothetical protein